MESRTAAAVLGVAPGASKHELRRAFRARVKVAHPDADGSDDEFIAVREAFDLLVGLADAAPATTAAATTTAPTAPGPLRHRGWVGHGRRPASTIDLTDVPRRPSPTDFRPTATGGRDTRGRDTRGLTFADHLEAQLAGQG
ncbi:MAG: DnaJ domain-containing protein [Acidimicrobiales bacterium]